ncbi:cytidine/deoxycytidylate deaminase-like protein [Blastomonas natatoria]|uniref:Cytidine/deoxycytidylate deaminase-like protein n=1 Tax=Blastomonas natatoria TaxID=34015 RepID=A0A2V3V9K0_9SPHN|nr:anti-phage dCTP deaminase [Blastomonas natatoria]PXW78486.1 cytidine/deoxycytidylate deaminase-like protein [Blastomonas natatoria]
MSDEPNAISHPELVFGIAGPIGIDIDAISQTLTAALQSVDYLTVPIRITAEIDEEITDVIRPESADYESVMSYKMDHASAVCRRYQSADTLMRFAMRAIRQHRASLGSPNQSDEQPDQIPPEDRVAAKTAYLIRQLKRPEEVDLMRKVYGRQFVLISAYGSADQRKRIIEQKLKRSLQLDVPEHEISAKADKLIHRDMNEDGDVHGQHLRETFHRADVFIDGINKKEMEDKTVRFIEALFGKSDIAPTKSEYGMYAAKSASLRSSDLSRQVGAAIFTHDGELITQGCNEVPKAFGGTYWDGEEPDFRDIKMGHDPNDILKREVIRDLLERLLRGGMLSEEAKNIGSSSDIVDRLTQKRGADPKTGEGALHGAQITDLTEYGRVVHAEMCAICDAARLGRSIKGGTLYCTTFPCHNCTKHILASGISKVIYMEPYPKSKAKELHENEIEIENESSERVSYLPFLGISPYRYRDIFQKGRRKKDGIAVEWYANVPRPMIDVPVPTYVDLEKWEYGLLLGQFQSISP